MAASASLVQKSLKSDSNFTTELQPKNCWMPNGPKFGPTVTIWEKALENEVKRTKMSLKATLNDTKEYKKAT